MQYSNRECGADTFNPPSPPREPTNHRTYIKKMKKIKNKKNRALSVAMGIYKIIKDI